MCDVLSIPEEEVSFWYMIYVWIHANIYRFFDLQPEILPPLETARRNRAFNVVHQSYMNHSWKDVLFMKLIRKNPNLSLEYCKKSLDQTGPLAKKQYDLVRRFRVCLCHTIWDRQTFLTNKPFFFIFSKWLILAAHFTIWISWSPRIRRCLTRTKKHFYSVFNIKHFEIWLKILGIFISSAKKKN